MHTCKAILIITISGIILLCILFIIVRKIKNNESMKAYYEFIESLDSAVDKQIYSLVLKSPPICKEVLETKNEIATQAGMGLTLDVKILIYLLGDRETRVETGYIIVGDNIVLHLEHVSTKALDRHKSYNHIFIPNHELLTFEDNKLVHFMKSIFVKTITCDKMFEKLHPAIPRVPFKMFTPILFDRELVYKHANLVIHPAGKSWMKNTHAVLETWRRFNTVLPPLIVTCAGQCLVKNLSHVLSLPDNVHMIELLDSDSMNKLWRMASICLAPSACEGFGHMIHTAYANGCICITTDQDPMNVYSKYMKIRTIPHIKDSQYKSISDAMNAFCFTVDPIDIKNAVQRVANLSMEEKRREGQAGNSAWNRMCQYNARISQHAINTLPM